MSRLRSVEPVRAIAIGILGLLIAGALPPWLFRNQPSIDPNSARHRELRNFVEEVSSRTAPGDRVAVLVPPELREAGTISFRLGYLMPRRHSVRAYDDRGELDPASLQETDWVATFHSPAPPLPLRVRYADSSGALYKVRP
jgi:hypothetical protein